ncbi:MAG: RloB family protein [Bacteroidota bacterium]
MILPRNRLFSRRPPERDATLILILCEGGKREPDYFNYFSNIDSRVNVAIIPADSKANNSPTGLYDLACHLTGYKLESVSPEFQLTGEDELWFVIDTDQWGDKIEALYRLSSEASNWFIAQSNPCFELWLYYHFSFEKPNFKGMAASKNWKAFLNKIIPGGFDSKKHPLLLRTAISNSEHNASDNQIPEFLETHVFKLGKSIYRLLHKKIDSARNKADL